MKALRVVLIVVGLATLIPSLIGLFMPWDRLVDFWETFGLKVAAETEGNLMVYMLRGLCMTMVWAGFLFLLSAADVTKYLALIRSLAVACVCVGLTCILVGVQMGIPAAAYLIDGIFCLVAGALIWTLSCPVACQCKQDEPAPATDD